VISYNYLMNYYLKYTYLFKSLKITLTYNLNFLLSF